MSFFSSSGDSQREYHLAAIQAPYIKQVLHNRSNPRAMEIALKNLHVILIQGSEKHEVLNPKNKVKLHRRNLPFGLYSLESDKKYLYIYFKKLDKLVKLEKRPFPFQNTLRFILLLLVGILITMYLLLMRSLKPLKKIQTELETYALTQKHINIRSSRKDEIAKLSNAFQDAIDQNRALLNARTLFMRNILHELNTPITKGRLITAMSTEYTKELDSVFNSLERNINEMAEVEKITSHQYNLDIKEYPIIEIIDHACDLLLLEKSVEHAIGAEKMRCDFSMMSIVFKNLIDNALKHGKSLNIYLEKENIVFSNKGSALSQPLKYYTQAFIQEESHSSGLGLGLYICDKILKQQYYHLNYHYKDETHFFSLETQISQ